jgi:hypothetical protein
MALLGESQLEPKPEKSLGIDQQFFKCLWGLKSAFRIELSTLFPKALCLLFHISSLMNCAQKVWTQVPSSASSILPPGITIVWICSSLHLSGWVLVFFTSQWTAGGPVVEEDSSESQLRWEEV